MREFVCPDCGGVSYTEDKGFKECSYCAERVIILNDEFSSLIVSSPKALSFLKTFDDISNARIIFDRRKGDRRLKKTIVNKKTRVSARRKNNSVVIGWIAVNKKN